jgi:hypothetical protein
MHQNVQKFGIRSLRHVLYMILKQPCMMLAPLITPYCFTIGKIQVSDHLPVKIINEKKIKTLPCYGSYKCSKKVSRLNLILNMCFTLSILCWKGYLSTDSLKAFGGAVALIISHVVLYFTTQRDKISKCIKHQKDDCLECIQLYGFSFEDYRIEMCEDHEGILPYERSSSPWERCEKCACITARWVLKIVNDIQIVKHTNVLIWCYIQKYFFAVKQNV